MSIPPLLPSLLLFLPLYVTPTPAGSSPGSRPQPRRRGAVLTAVAAAAGDSNPNPFGWWKLLRRCRCRRPTENCDNGEQTNERRSGRRRRRRRTTTVAAAGSAENELRRVTSNIAHTRVGESLTNQKSFREQREREAEARNKPHMNVVSEAGEKGQ